MKKILFSILFLLALYRLSYAGAISVDAFVTGDDITVTHLETMRATFQGAINSTDGSLIRSESITTAKLDANANPENRWNEAFGDFVFTGLLPPTTTSGLSSTTTAGTAYINGVRVIKDATPNTYTASKHTYVDLSSTGTYTYQEVAINATAPSVATNSIRLALVSTDTSKVLSVIDKRATAITLSNTISFNAHSAGQSDIAPSTYVTITFGNEIFDTGSDFASNTFTAPITGKYLLSYCLQLEDIDSATTKYLIILRTSNRDYNIYFDPTRFSADLEKYPITLSVLADMDADDTAYVIIYQDGGTQQTDISDDVSFFSGYFVG